MGKKLAPIVGTMMFTLVVAMAFFLGILLLFSIVVLLNKFIFKSVMIHEALVGTLVAMWLYTLFVISNIVFKKWNSPIVLALFVPVMILPAIMLKISVPHYVVDMSVAIIIPILVDFVGGLVFKL